MKNYIKSRDGAVGFGGTPEEAYDDWYLNKCSQSLSYDSKGIYKARRDVLKPWLPTEFMLHLSGVGCLEYRNNYVTNLANGIRVPVTYRGGSIYYYMAHLFGAKLSYADITVSIRPEVEKFFYNISNTFFSIGSYPQIQLLNQYNGFEVKTKYYTDNGILMGVSGDSVGIKFVGDEYYLATEFSQMNSIAAMMARIGYKLGVIVTEKGVYRDGYANNGLG